MAMMMIDKLAYSSPLRYKSTFLKSLFAIGTLLICVTARSFAVSLIILVIMGCLTVKYSQASFCRYIKMMAGPLVFLALGTIAIVIDFSHEPIGLWHTAIGSRYVVITMTSLIYASRLILVSLASVSCLYFLILTTTMLDILMGLRRIHCPWLILEPMMLIYRFIFVFLDSALAITTAQNCRLGNRDLKTSIKSMGQMLAALLVLALGKSSRIFDAMEARCYEGQIEMIDESYPAKAMEIAAVAVYLAALAAIAFWCRAKGGL